MHQKLYPGILDDSFEFFVSHGNRMFFNNGAVNPITHLPFSIVDLLNKEIEKNPEAKAILMEWHPDSEFKQMAQLIECRFSGLDFTPDVKEGVLQEAEYWECPKRGNCAGEGILCKSFELNGHVFNKTEIKLIQLSTTDKTNEVIADELDLPLGTFHKMKQSIHQNLGNVQTKQRLTQIAYHHNLI